MNEEIPAKSGVFWVIEGELFIVPFDENAEIGIAKSGRNYNHKLLWESVKPHKCNKEYDYYPRGRVEINKRNEAVIYLNPNIDEEMVEKIKNSFSLPDDVRVHYDGSSHYMCELDR